MFRRVATAHYCAIAPFYEQEVVKAFHDPDSQIIGQVPHRAEPP